MDVSNDGNGGGSSFLYRVVRELESYAPYIFATLVAQHFDCLTSLQIWKAAKRLPHIVLKSPDRDVEKSPASEEEHARSQATRKAVARATLRASLSKLSLFLTFSTILLIQALVLEFGLLTNEDGSVFKFHSKRNGEGWDDAIGMCEETTGSAILYYDSVFGRFPWSRYFYPMVLTIPIACVFKKFVSTFTGAQARIVFRSTANTVEILEKSKVNRGVRITLFLMGVFAAMGALLLESTFFVAMVIFMMILCLNASISASFVSSTKFSIIRYYSSTWPILYLVQCMSTSQFYRTIPIAPDGTDWTANIAFVLASATVIPFLSFCFRLDCELMGEDEMPHLAAGPALDPALVNEGLISGAPDLKAVELGSVRVDEEDEIEMEWCKARMERVERVREEAKQKREAIMKAGGVRRRYRGGEFRVVIPYQIAGFTGFALAHIFYAIITAYRVSGSLHAGSTAWNATGALELAPISMVICIAFVAWRRGEVKKILWNYEEDYMKDWTHENVQEGEVSWFIRDGSPRDADGETETLVDVSDDEKMV